MGLKIDLICCGESVKLEQFPANYPNDFMGRCGKCQTAFGIQDLTEILDEDEDEDEDENEDC